MQYVLRQENFELHRLVELKSEQFWICRNEQDLSYLYLTNANNCRTRILETKYIIEMMAVGTISKS